MAHMRLYGEREIGGGGGISETEELNNSQNSVMGSNRIGGGTVFYRNSPPLTPQLPTNIISTGWARRDLRIRASDRSEYQALVGSHWGAGGH